MKRKFAAVILEPAAKGSYEVIDTVDGNVRSYEDTTVEDDVTYCYVVSAHFAKSCPDTLLDPESAPSNEICLSTCDEPPCEQPTISGWIFTDQGFIAGGQDGAFRAYHDPSEVTASPWSFLSPDKRSFKIAFEDDGLCYGSNQLMQVATVEAVVTVGCSTQLTVSWDGIVEWENGGYDKMYLYVDDVQVGYAESREEGRGCDYMGPPLSDPEPPIQISLDRGMHLLHIRADTRDARYHTGAYYEFELSLQPE